MSAAIATKTRARSALADLPRRLGPYELLAPIGAGGLSTVYLARRAVLAGVYRDVAVKVLHPGVGTDGASGVDLLEEARVAARMRHPNVVPVLEVGQDAERMFLVMEYVEGDSVAGLIRHAAARGERVPLPIAGRILIDALAGLHAAHELRADDGTALELVHRDFTPHNVLVGTDGMTRLIDFGIAKTTDGQGRTATGLVKGKVAYMAPEQALGRTLDRRCDVWAAGVVAWELLTGRRMIKAESEAAVLLRVVTEDAPRPSSERPDLPAEIDAAVSDALERDLDRRLPSADALRERLLAAWRFTGPLAEPADVGAYVAEAVRPRLARLRELVDGSVAALDAPATRTLSVTRRTARGALRGAVVLAGTAAVAAAIAWTAARATGPDGGDHVAAPSAAAPPSTSFDSPPMPAPETASPATTPSEPADAAATEPAADSQRPHRLPAATRPRPRRGGLPGLAPPTD